MNEFFYYLNLGEEEFLKNPKHSSRISAVYAWQLTLGVLARTEMRACALQVPGLCLLFY